MSIIKAKVEIHLQLDSEDYPIPADGQLSLQLKDDIQDAVESALAVEINAIKITGVSAKHAKDRNQIRD